MDRATLQRLLIGEFTWRRLVRSLLFIYGFFALYVFLRADSMIFLPPPASYGNGDTVLKIPVNGDQHIAALHLPNDQADYTLLFIHGNAEDLGYLRPFLTQLHDWGFSVFAYDYRGYGLSDGRPSERNAYGDAAAAYGYLTATLGVPPEQILVYGRSVGGGSATALAAQYPVGGLILESTFTSAFRVISPIPLLPFDKFPNRRRLRQITAPVLVMHGESDEIVPFHHGQALYAAAPSPKAFLWIPEAGHNDFAWVAGDRLPQALQDFAQQVGGSPAP
jgi:pimeloyl-ACP methyl ester carboxylesterase